MGGVEKKGDETTGEQEKREERGREGERGREKRERERLDVM